MRAGRYAKADAALQLGGSADPARIGGHGARRVAAAADEQRGLSALLAPVSEPLTGPVSPEAPRLGWVIRRPRRASAQRSPSRSHAHAQYDLAFLHHENRTRSVSEPHEPRAKGARVGSRREDRRARREAAARPLLPQRPLRSAARAQGLTRPSRMAKRTSPATLCTSSLFITLVRCVSAVRVETPRLAAISLLESPSAIS